MPSILVVDRDERVPKRVRQALHAEGWTVTHARDVTEALQSAGSEAPDLFLVSSDLPSAANLLDTFARRRGGPGTLALVSDPVPPGGAGGAKSPGVGLGEDGVVARSFDESQLRTAVEHILRTSDRPAAPASDEPKLTSHDIFGDLVAEVERETGVREPVPPKAATPRAATPSRSAEAPAAGGTTARSAEVAPPKHRTMDEDLERKLEQTLSGVLGSSGTSTTSSSGRVRPAAAPGGTTARSGEVAAPGGGSDDVEKLLSATLSGLDLPGTAPRKRPPAPPPPAAGPEPPRFDLADFEALVERSKRGREAAPPPAPGTTAQSAEVAPPKPEPARTKPPPDPAPPARADEPARPPLELSSLFSEEMHEVPEAEAEAGKESGVARAPAGDGKDFGQYHLLERIGVGGMAEVWKARMRGVEGFQKTVAIKRILPHLTDSPDFVEMFVDEAKLAAQLNHANIIHIYDLGKLGHDYYIAMEYVEGENLRAILNRARERGTHVAPGIALHVAARLASALDYAHRKRDFEDRELGLVHRDVSPQNVLVGYEGTIKLCDFGIVKAVSKSSHTQMGALKGKLQYMSPEQAWGRTVDGRSDIFAVGCLLFEMLTGRRLFVGESEMEVLEAVRECRVRGPSELVEGLDPAIDEVVLQALAREPQDRFQTAGELERRIEGILTSLRPTPGQAELASFVARLFGQEAGPLPAPPPQPAAEAPPEPPASEEPPAVSAGASPVSERDGEGSAVAPPAEAPASPEPGPPEGEAPVEAVAPVREVDPEEGGRRGKGLLVAAIVLALVLGGLLVWYLLARGAAEEPEAPPAAVEEPAVPPPAPGAAEPGAGEAPQDETPAEAGSGEVAAAGAGAAPAEPEAGEPEPDGPDPLEQVVEEELARREEELARREELLRQQFEEEERRLQRQLRELEESARREAENRAREPAGGTTTRSGEVAAPSAEVAPPPAVAPEPAPGPPAAEPEGTGPEGPGGEGPGAPDPGPAPATRAVPASDPAPGPARVPPIQASSPPPPPAPAPEPEPEPEPEPPRERAVREGDLVTMGPGVQAPKLVRFEKPEYPPIARRLRIEGVVVVSVLVGETGAVFEARLVQSAGRDVGLDEAALEAARNARYEPATKNGVRVKMWTTLRIPFEL